jgi:hypothetical protein
VRLNADRSFPYFELGEALRSFAKKMKTARLAEMTQILQGSSTTDYQLHRVVSLIAP